ncbi:inorganic phosphate transporter [uncultured Methanoregula sp.]|uniref:inorganic phosphate transporter n=1 Tax=uncultured Methanoregula sp. TaxID=1005933 RepID=UPI002AAB316F|nr:inorganic phosphate transporter [uncultured Methanoregula sp.]
MIELAILAVLLALAFTFTNGFQDASSIAATFIASRSATPKMGIILVATMSFFGAVGGGSAVAFTLTGLLTLPSAAMVIVVLLVAMMTATAWNLITWKFGLPSSSSHSLIGGLIGAGIAAAGVGSVFWGVDELFGPTPELAGFIKILFFFVLSVVIGFAGSYVMHRCTTVLLRNAERTVNRKIIALNWCAAAVMAFSNAANDTQKQLGIIALVLFSAGISAVSDVPLWARLACAVLIALGTLSGGWRIMSTLGRRIFRIEPIHSFDSQFFSAASVAMSTVAGAPVSSTQVITMSVLGVGAAENPRKVKWEVGRHILVAMAVTIPVTMLIAAGLYLIVAPIMGV